MQLLRHTTDYLPSFPEDVSKACFQNITLHSKLEKGPNSKKKRIS
jgi:hypothetical protein